MLVCTRVCVIFSTPSSNPARVMTDIATLPLRKLSEAVEHTGQRAPHSMDADACVER